MIKQSNIDSAFGGSLAELSLEMRWSTYGLF